jgi:hypothetical protein
MERESISEKLASKEQVARLKELVDLYKEPQDVIDKWLSKANAETFDEMNETIIIKLINHMENKSKPKDELKEKHNNVYLHPDVRRRNTI